MEISNPQQPLQNIIPNHAKFITSHKTVNKKIKNKTNNRNQAKCALISKKLITPAPITNTASNTDIINKLQTMLIAGQYDQMLLVDINLITQSSQILIVWKLLAQAHANLGQHEQAENYCNDMLKIDEFYAPTYFIMAQISLEIGQEHKRKQLLKKALYLDHNFIAPMLELAEIAYSEGHFDKAKKLRKSAHKILITLPDTATVEMLENWTVQDLREQVRELL
jgi:chemotaxis protein methyltransferase CheR